MASSPMTTLIKGRLYYANRRWFTHPGLHLWTGKRHVRILPSPRRRRRRR